MKTFKLTVVLLLVSVGVSTSQNLGIKTNLLYGGATMTPNLAIEIGLGQKTTLNLSAGYNFSNLAGSDENNKKMVHLLAQPEFRYWTCEKFNGHFFGAHALYSKYNVGGYDIPLLFEKEFRYQGTAVGGGVSYGYHWMWSKRWGMEFNLGLGFAMLQYDKFDCPKCGEKTGTFKKTYIGPTKAGISLIYLIK